MLHFLRPDVTVDIDLEAQAMDRAFQLTEEFFAAQSNVAFPLKVGRHCFRCPYFRGACPADLTSAGRPFGCGIDSDIVVMTHAGV